MSVFNVKNTEWKTGEHSLFLGQQPALYDSVNVRYPKIFSIYKLQKSIDWSEDEINLEQSRLDLLNCPKSTYDIMLETIAFQWEADSVASRAIAPLLAPFVTNSEYWAAVQKVSEIEVLHALTYSEIVRQCVLDPNEVFSRVMYNNNVLDRLNVVAAVFEDLRITGAKYSLGLVDNNQSTYNVIFKAIVALYCLERLQFVASFAATFAIVEQGYFQGIGKLVQKIMQDEIGCHAELDRLVIEIELKTERGQIAMTECYDDIVNIITCIIDSEKSWNRYLFSDGRSIVGLNVSLLDEWVDYNASAMAETFMPSSFVIDSPKSNPLKYMDNWLDINKFQNAQQEADGNNYALNTIVNNIDDLEMLDF
jgi:ribonucleoside-diphosphate reductase beta chain